MTVWLTQWLCSARHCAFAIPWDPSLGQMAAEIESVGQRIALEQGINLRCGICGRSIAPEHSPTRCSTLAEAFRALEVVQAEQLATRAVLDRLGLTRDVLP